MSESSQAQGDSNTAARSQDSQEQKSPQPSPPRCCGSVMGPEVMLAEALVSSPWEAFCTKGRVATLLTCTSDDSKNSAPMGTTFSGAPGSVLADGNVRFPDTECARTDSTCAIFSDITT